MESYFPAYAPKDLLALYTFTGGIPHYLEAFADEGSFTYGSMLDQMLDQQSFFLTEGKFLLIQEFGKEYTYNELNKKAIIGEVKMNAKNISMDILRAKATAITKHLGGYSIEYQGYSLPDIVKDKLV